MVTKMEYQMTVMILDEEYSTEYFDISDWADEFVYYLAARDIIKGMGDNTFSPKGKATIEQALVISERMFIKYVLHE